MNAVRQLSLLFWLLPAILPAAAADGPAERFRASVAAVPDGDTLVLDTGETIGLIGVDCPGAKGSSVAAGLQTEPHRDYYAREAAAATRALVLGKQVTVEVDRSLKDPHGRALAYVYASERDLLNARIVREGHGFASTDPPFAQSRSFVLYERQAYASRRGMWRYPMRCARAVLPEPTEESGTRTVAADTVVYTGLGSPYYHRQGCKDLVRGAPVMNQDAAALKAAGFEPCPECRPVFVPAPPKPTYSAAQLAAIFSGGQPAAAGFGGGGLGLWNPANGSWGSASLGAWGSPSYGYYGSGYGGLTPGYAGSGFGDAGGSLGALGGLLGGGGLGGGASTFGGLGGMMGAGGSSLGGFGGMGGSPMGGFGGMGGGIPGLGAIGNLYGPGVQNLTSDDPTVPSSVPPVPAP